MTLANSINTSQSGFQSLTSSGTFNGRTLTAGTGITITNADGTIGNPIISSFTPNSILSVFDDFVGAEFANNADLISQQVWFNSNGGLPWNQTSTLGTSANPGVIGNPSFGSGDNGLYLNNSTGTLAPQILLGGGTITLNFIIKVATLSTASPRYILRVGFGDTSNADQANGLYFEYSDNINSGNWVYKSSKASSRTTSNSSTAVTSAYHNLQISVNAAGTSASFSVDGVSLGTAISTNIPVLAITPFVDIVQSAGTVADNSIIIDLFYMNQILTTAR